MDNVNWMQSGSYGAGSAYGQQGVDRQALYDQYKSMFDKANTANESRYQDILGKYQQRRERTLADLQGSGDQERKDIATQYQGLGSRLGQNMVSRGLSGSSIAPTMQMGLQREQADAMGRLNDRLRTQRIGYDTGLDQDTLQFMERKNEIGPSMEQLLSLSQGLGSAQGGMGATISAGGTGVSRRFHDGQEDTGAGFNLRNVKEMPQQGVGENDAAFQQRVGQWGQWERQNDPRGSYGYGDKTNDYNSLGEAMNWLRGRQGQDAARQSQNWRNVELNPPRGGFDVL